MTRPQVSVVMGVYNAQGHVSQTLDSVLGQEGVDLEFIVVDDGSTDGTGRILDERAHRDPRLRVLHQPNAGLTRALVAGCEAASAPLIARQDAGDLSLPGRLATQAALLSAHPRLAFVSCATAYVDPQGAFLYANAGSGRARSPMDVIDLQEPHGMADGPSHHGSVMFTREAYRAAGGYRPAFYFAQDWDLWYRLAALGAFCMLGETLYRARVGVGDISTSNREMQQMLAALSLEALHRRSRGEGDDEILARASRLRPHGPARGSPQPAQVAAAGYFLGECLRRNGDAQRAREYFRLVLRHRPWHAKAWVRLAQASLSAGKAP